MQCKVDRIQLKFAKPLTDFKETFKLSGDTSLSFLSAEVHHSSDDLAASCS